MNDISIRPLASQDLNDIKIVIDRNQMFPPEMLEPMVEPFFSDEDCQEIWLTLVTDKPVAVAYCAPEQMTDRVWNMLLIAVDPDVQGQGLGGKLMQHLEQLLKEKDQRILLVETSGLPDFAQTRQFYLNHQYEQQARIKDYYEDGDDKIVFWKRLG